MPIGSLCRLAGALLAASAGTAATAADAAPTRHCVLLAAEYTTQGHSSTEILDALRYNTRLSQAMLLDRMLGDHLVANTFLVDVDDRSAADDKVRKTRAITGCDTVVELRNVFWGSALASAFGFDVVIQRTNADASTTLYSRQYRYTLDKATQTRFSYDGFAEMAWNDMRESGAFDADREASPVRLAAVRAEYDRLAAAWPIRRDEYHLRQIVRGTQLLASMMIARLHDQNPPDFSVLAADSDDVASKERGGDMGWVAPSDLPPEIAQAVMAQRGPGLVDRPIEAGGGWHVIEVLGQHSAHPPSFDSVRDGIARNLRWNAVVPAATWAQALKD